MGNNKTLCQGTFHVCVCINLLYFIVWPGIVLQSYAKRYYSFRDESRAQAKQMKNLCAHMPFTLSCFERFSTVIIFAGSH